MCAYIHTIFVHIMYVKVGYMASLHVCVVCVCEQYVGYVLRCVAVRGGAILIRSLLKS